MDESETYHVPSDEVIVDPTIIVSTLAYPLRESEYHVLSKISEGFLWSLATIFLGIFIGSGLVVAAKYIDAIIGKTSIQIESWEKWLLFISVALFFLFLILFFFCPSERKKLLREIGKHISSERPRVESHRSKLKRS